jgi:DNA-binding transcriptional LysR family regulator
VAQLEESLGARLIERSTRRFRVTEVGQGFYERCQAIMSDIESAQAAVAEVLGDPQGAVRFSCPPGMLQILSPILPAFLAKYPKVRLQILSSNKPVDLIDQNIDVAMRMRNSLDADASLMMRTLASSSRILVASPGFARTIAEDAGVDALKGLPTLSLVEQGGEDTWLLVGPEGKQRTINLAPRMVCGDLSTIRNATAAGTGVAFIPNHACLTDIRNGTLVQVLKEWSGPPGVIHLVFTTRRALPAVRAFIEFLAAAFKNDLLLRSSELSGVDLPGI